MEYTQILKQLILSSMISLLIFLMINVAFAQLLTSTILNAIDGNTSLTTIIFLGFVLATVIAVCVNLLTSDSYQKLRVFYSALFALLGNLVFWIVIAFFFVLRAYPGLFPDPQSTSFFLDVFTRGAIYLFSIPRMLSYFALYILNNITLFWIYSLISYSVFYSLFLIQFGGK